MFGIPDGVGGRFSVFTAVGLLPASLVGIDVVRLLEGAAAMTRRFRESPVSENPVLQYVAISHLAEEKLGATIRILSSWSNQLEAVGLWYDQLLSESLGEDEKVGYKEHTPWTVQLTHPALHEPPEGGRGVAEAKTHAFALIKAKVTNREWGSLRVFLFHLNLPVS